MYIKVTKSGPRQYVQLVEGYRGEDGKVRQRTIASLGRLEVVGEQVDSIIKGLQRVTGRESTASTQPPQPLDILFQPAKALGDSWVLDCVWRDLGFDRLDRALSASSKRKFSVEQLLKVMVFNRLCDPASKLGISRWLERATVPGVDPEAVTHQRLLRAMDSLIKNRVQLDRAISSLLRPLIDTDLAVVFYDLTTVRAEGLAEQDEDVRKYGRSKDGGVRKQFVLGVVQTAEGLPIFHQVFDGNVAEVTTLKSSLEEVMSRFPIRRVVAIADRGLMSTHNLDELREIKTPSGEPLEFILAVPGRRYGEFTELLEPMQRNQFAKATDEALAETAWDGLRLVVAHNPKKAAEQTAERDAKIKALEDQADDWAEQLDAQDQGAKKRGRPLSDGGARAKFYHRVLENKLGNIIKVDMKSELFSYTVDRKARRLAELNDGKLLLVTNVPDLSPQEIVSRYKALADIERGFKVLKSELEIGPVHHRLPDRIRAHAHICFIALILHRVLRQRLKASGAGTSPERALEQLKSIQYHRVEIGGHQHSGITTLATEQQALLASLNAPKPPKVEQLSLV
jgi:transposase